MIVKYTGDLKTDRAIALSNLRAYRIALRIFEGDPELSGNLHVQNRSNLRHGIQTARAIRAGRIHYDCDQS